MSSVFVSLMNKRKEVIQRDRKKRTKVLVSQVMNDPEILEALALVTRNLTIVVNKLMEFEGTADSSLIAYAVLKHFERRHNNFLLLINWFVYYFQIYV